MKYIPLKYRKLLNYFLDRLAESSSIQGFAAIFTFVYGMNFTDQTLAGITALAAMISATLKIMLPDNLRIKKTEDNG